jgi:hypothetical protein
MTEAAATTTGAPAAAPAAPQSAPASPASPAPSADGDEDFFSSSDNFHEFMGKVEARAKAQQKAPPKPPEQKSQQTMEQPKVTAPTEELGEAPTEELGTETPAELDEAAQQAADAEQWGKIKAWMQTGGEVPAELAEVPIQLPNGRYETMAEVVKGFMRQDDHTRGWQEAQTIKQQSEAAVNAYKQHFEQIENPDPKLGGEAMYEVYTRGPRRAAAMEMARKLAIDEQEDITHARGYAIATAMRERLLDQQGQPLWNHRDVSKAFDEALKERERIRADRDMGRQRDWENERLRQQTQQTQRQTQQQEYGKNVEKQLEQLRPRAFKALGILHDAENSQIFRRKLAARAEQIGPGATLTPELVMEAARMTRDHLENERAARSGNGTKPQQRQFQPQLGGGAGKIPPKASEEYIDDEAFAKKFGIRSW